MATNELTVFTARKIITMNRSWPHATAIATKNGRIVEVGTLETLKPWLEAHPYHINDQFADKVVVPGFIDPHLHPSMAAVLLPMRFITATRWELPWETVQPVTTPEDFSRRLHELHSELTPDEPLFTWGYHQLWHGPMNRELLNAVSNDRPIIVWHRSFHELYMNDAAMEWLGITANEAAGKQQIDLAAGRFYENGLAYAIVKLNPYILSNERYQDGLRRLVEVAHHGGHTTLGDMAVGLFNFDMEWQGTKDVLGSENTPFRTVLVPSAANIASIQGGHDQALSFIEALADRDTERLLFPKHVKLFTDGAFFSQLAQLKEPGYIDGHLGEWLVAPEQFIDIARRYWNAGYKIHVHCTGDLGLELALDALDTLQWERPRFDHRYTIEHFGFSTPEQVARIAALGALVSANVYYVHELSAIYAQQGIGHERADQMARVGSCVRAGIRTAVHSDFTMAPASPLNNAWVASTRRNLDGDVVCPEETLTLDQALAAITIDAAYVLGMEEEIGSLRAGKSADFTVLDTDPYAVGAEGLKDIAVDATVFKGTAYLING